FCGLLGAAVLRDGSGLEAYRTRQAAGPLAFNLLDWEVQQLGPRLGVLVPALSGAQAPPDPADAQSVRAYFEASPPVRASMRDQAEAAIQRLVTEAWRDENLAAPSPLAGGRPILFTPVTFIFAQPPQ